MRYIFKEICVNFNKEISIPDDAIAINSFTKMNTVYVSWLEPNSEESLDEPTKCATWVGYINNK